MVQSSGDQECECCPLADACRGASEVSAHRPCEAARDLRGSEKERRRAMRKQSARGFQSPPGRLNAAQAARGCTSGDTCVRFRGGLTVNPRPVPWNSRLDACIGGLIPGFRVSCHSDGGDLLRFSDSSNQIFARSFTRAAFGDVACTPDQPARTPQKFRQPYPAESQRRRRRS